MKRTQEEKRLTEMLQDLEADDRFLELTHHLWSDEHCLQIWPPADALEYPKRPFEFFIVERGFGMKHRTSTIIEEVGAGFLAGTALRYTCCAKSFMYDVMMAMQRDERLQLSDIGTYQKAPKGTGT